MYIQILFNLYSASSAAFLYSVDTVYPQLWIVEWIVESGVHLFSLKLPKLSLSDGSIGDREQRDKIK